MNLSAVAKRIDRLENRRHKVTHKIRIAYLTYDKWAVVRDFQEFNTLQEAVNYVKSQYATKCIEVSQMPYVISKLSDEDLGRTIDLLDADQDPDKHLSTQQQAECDAKMQELLTKPCDQVLQVKHMNPSIKFELYCMTTDEVGDYLKAKFKDGGK